jgi:hypothetical protein
MSALEDGLRRMYDLGLKHGIEQGRLMEKIERCEFCGSEPLSANCNGAKCDV